MSYVDQFIHKLNQTAPSVKSVLRQVGSIDIQSEKLQLKLQQQRQDFLNQLKVWQNKKEASGKKALEKKYKEIATKDKQLLALSKQKVQLAENLYNFIHEPTQKLDKQLLTRGEKFSKIDKDLKLKKGKKKGRPTKEEWENDPNQPKYCYCSKASFGQMVMCQNTYCQREWFHRECLEQKKLPQKWFCRDCRQKL